MIIKELVVGPIMANCFILGCEETKMAVVIDPGAEAELILSALSDLNLKAQYILNTHGHFDHAGANRGVKEATGAAILIHSLDAPMLGQLSAHAEVWGMSAEDSPAPDRTLADCEKVSFGNITLTVIHTPGHTAGGVSFRTNREVFVGDTLFAASIGRTDFPGGDQDTLIASIKGKLFALKDDMTVFTGHGPKTTIGREKRYNPYVGLC